MRLEVTYVMFLHVQNFSHIEEKTILKVKTKLKPDVLFIYVFLFKMAFVIIQGMK